MGIKEWKLFSKRYENPCKMLFGSPRYLQFCVRAFSKSLKKMECELNEMENVHGKMEMEALDCNENGRIGLEVGIEEWEWKNGNGSMGIREWA